MGFKMMEQTLVLENRQNNYFFQLCRHCFWCVTLLKNIIEQCPVCKKSDFDKLPISLNERYQIRHDEKAGICLKFLPR